MTSSAFLPTNAPSLSGEKLSSFRFEAERARITWKHLEFYMRADEAPRNFAFVARNKDDIRLPEYFPYFPRLALDPQGRILIYDSNTARFSREVSFRVLAADGRPLASVKLDPGEYKPVMPVFFWNAFAYADLAKADGDTFVFTRFRMLPDAAAQNK